jgi:hypothetical protein
MIAKKFTERLKFKNWPNHTIPSVAAGAYVIWQGDELLYAGMSGREIEKAIKNGKKKYGLSTRLASHASGRLSGDPFCAYVSNRIIIPELKQSQLNKFKNGLVTLDQMTKKFIRTKLDYQYLLVERSQDAYDLANHCRSGAIFGVKPTFNPI